jgi:hypothetical protein
MPWSICVRDRVEEEFCARTGPKDTGWDVNRNTVKLRYPIKPQTEVKVRMLTSNQSEAILRLRYKEVEFEEGRTPNGKIKPEEVTS